MNKFLLVYLFCMENFMRWGKILMEVYGTDLYLKSNNYYHVRGSTDL